MYNGSTKAMELDNKHKSFFFFFSYHMPRCSSNVVDWSAMVQDDDDSVEQPNVVIPTTTTQQKPFKPAKDIEWYSNCYGDKYMIHALTGRRMVYTVDGKLVEALWGSKAAHEVFTHKNILRDMTTGINYVFHSEAEKRKAMLEYDPYVRFAD
jgi:hypothetical protein